MNHRHLLPNEIDLLVDGEVGFGVAPLLAHVRECDACRLEVEDGRQIASVLEELPRFAPSYGLADRVMAQVPVFVPWHVAARDAVMEWVPASKPFRALALAGGSALAALLTMATLWVITRGELVSMVTVAAGDRVRSAFSIGLREVLASVFGEQVFTAIAQPGIPLLAVAGAGFVVAAALAVLGLRAAAAAGRRRA
ncbi:MAG TPA: hypothetical protein VFT96_09665 [Gemmatimonadaceae bacterium]|nr:hypothetical protein [Gemmatimonadaceae bacterium]